jgi:hypothetical protein
MNLVGGSGNTSAFTLRRRDGEGGKFDTYSCKILASVACGYPKSIISSRSS